MNYIYLLQVREFLGTNIYKLGKTKKENLIRFNQYPKGSRLISQFDCENCDVCERTLIHLFSTKYIQRREYGTEYFEGDVVSMKDDIYMETRGCGIIVNPVPIVKSDSLVQESSVKPYVSIPNSMENRESNVQISNTNIINSMANREPNVQIPKIPSRISINQNRPAHIKGCFASDTIIRHKRSGFVEYCIYKTDSFCLHRCDSNGTNVVNSLGYTKLNQFTTENYKKHLPGRTERNNAYIETEYLCKITNEYKSLSGLHEGAVYN
jgi:hypothetical protein